MKRKLFAFLMGSALVFGLAACGGDDNAGEDTGTDNGNGGATTAANGEEVFKQNCAACHGQDLTGGVGPNLTDVGSRLSQDEIEGIIENGKGAMRAGIVEGADKEAVASWLAEKK